MIKYAPVGTPLHKAYHGKDAHWEDPKDQLLAMIVDAIAVGNWQRQGDQQALRPDPIPRPGVDGHPKVVEAYDDDESFDIDEFDELYGS